MKKTLEEMTLEEMYELERKHFPLVGCRTAIHEPPHPNLRRNLVPLGARKSTGKKMANRGKKEPPRSGDTNRPG